MDAPIIGNELKIFWILLTTLCRLPTLGIKNLKNSPTTSKKLTGKYLWNVSFTLYRLDSETFSFGTFNSLLAGLDRNWVNGTCCSVQTAHKPVKTSAAKQELRAYCLNIYCDFVWYDSAIIKTKKNLFPKADICIN